MQFENMSSLAWAQHLDWNCWKLWRGPMLLVRPTAEWCRDDL